jgi:hypothetical protein
LARKAIKEPSLLPTILQDVSAPTARTRFISLKALQMLSEQHPGLLYPHFEFFVRLLDHPKQVMQWEASRVLSHLVQLDAKGKFDAVFAKYFAPIAGPSMITAANVIRAGARIALAKPELADRIAAEVLKVSTARYQTAECRNVVIGHALLALGEFFHLLKQPAPVIQFVTAQTANPRPATRKKAGKLPKQRERASRCALRPRP